MNNFTCNDTTALNPYCCKPFRSDTSAIKRVKTLCYCVLLLLSILGNSLLVTIIKMNKRMQTITNYLIANMAVSDILITLLVVPRQITEILVGPRRWLINGLVGSILCKSVYFLQDITTAVSIFSLVVIAIDRYRGIVFPFRKQLMNPAKLCKIVIPLIWIVSMSLHAVYFYIFRVVRYNAETYCAPSWAAKPQETYYLIGFVCLIAFPACLVTFLYFRVILNLKRSRVSKFKGPSSLKRLREDTKVVRNIMAVLIAFLVCTIPINVYGILFYFVWDWKMPCGMENFGFAAHFILYSNASVNPWIYFVLNDKYRHCLVNILMILHIVRKRAVTKRESSTAITLEKLNILSSAGISSN